MTTDGAIAGYRRTLATSIDAMRTVFLVGTSAQDGTPAHPQNARTLLRLDLHAEPHEPRACSIAASAYL
jgi:hypothetical protein